MEIQRESEICESVILYQMSSGKPYLMSSSFSCLSRPMNMVKSPASGRALK